MSTSAQSPVDLAHLARYTGGERSLDSEILQLFVRQSAELVAELSATLAARDRERWHHITHSLKGAARGVGAFDFADIAAQADSINLAKEPASASTVISKLQASMVAVHAFVQDFVASAA